MVVDGVWFNDEWVASHTFPEFLKEFEQYDHIFPDVKNRKEKFKEVWDLHQKKPENPQVQSED